MIATDMKILFIGHNASRTGAPIVLLHFLEWCNENAKHLQIDLSLLTGGELENEYAKFADVYVIRPNYISTVSSHKSDVKSIIKKSLSFLGNSIFKLKTKDKNYDLVVANTVISASYLKFFKKTGIPTICWLHELENVIDITVSTETFTKSIPYIDEFIVVSKAVKAMLIDKFGVDEKKIHLVYEFSKVNFNNENVERNSLLRELNFPDDAFIVGGSGTIEWRKGTDLFIQLASKLVTKQSDIYFLWVGGNLSGVEEKQIISEIKKNNLENRVLFVGNQSNPHSFYTLMDLFTLTSREDPFPLVCIEVALLGKPIICFENSGGIPEFVEDDAGAVVQFENTDEMAEKIIQFYNDRELLNLAGTNAREKATLNFSLENSCKKLEQIFSKANN